MGQKKTKGGLESNTKPATTKSSVQLDANPMRRPAGQPQNSRPTPKSAPSPAGARVARVGSEESPARRLPSTLKEGGVVPTSKPAAGHETKRKVFSPVRDPLGNSGSAGDISGR